jgi:hypothetical protein
VLGGCCPSARVLLLWSWMLLLLLLLLTPA